MDANQTVSLSELPPLAGRKYFSVAEANRALPLVSRIVADVVRDYAQLLQLREACQNHDARGNLLDAEETRHQYAAVTDHLSGLNDEIEKIGCELKDYQVGLVDFPGLLDGRHVYFCWKLGEERVAHWHELSTGYAGRQPLPS